MNVALIVTTLGLGGTENWVELAARELVRRGHHVLVVAEHPPLDRAVAIAECGATVRCFASPPSVEHYSALLNEFRADIIHLNIWERGAEVEHVGAAIGIPVVKSHHYTLRREWPGLVWRAWALLRGGRAFTRELHRYQRLISGHIGCCDASARDVRRAYGRSVKGRVFSLRNAVPEVPPISLTVMTGPPRFLQVGALVDRKRPDATLRAFQGVVARIPGATLTFAGDGPLAPKLRSLAEKMRIGNVTFAGETRDVERLYRASNVVVLPSRHEGLPYSLLEAASRGLPLIATSHGGMPELVRDGQNGFIVPKSGTRSLAAAMIALAESPALRANMGERSRFIAGSEFGMYVHGEKLEEIYRHVIATARLGSVGAGT